MFGFLGTPESSLKWEANGTIQPVNAPSERAFSFSHGGTLERTARFFFDYDNVNPAKADSEALLNTTNIPYSGRPLATLNAHTVVTGGLVTTANIAGSSISAILGKTVSYTSYRRFRYANVSPLSPATRKLKVLFDYYNTRSIIFHTEATNGSILPGSNNITGILDIPFDQIPYCEALVIGESYVSELYLKFNNPRFRYFKISRNVNLSVLNGKLPDTIHTIIITGIGSVTNIDSLIENCINCETFLLGNSSGSVLTILALATTTLTGTLDISHMTMLKEFTLPLNPGLNSIVLPEGKTDWSWFQITGLNTSAASSFNTTILDNVLNSSSLRVFCLINSQITYNKNIGNSDISNSLIGFNAHGNLWTGDISITSPRPNLKEFKTGNSSFHSVSLGIFQNVDITGLTNALIIDLTGGLIENLQLPSNTVCSTLRLYDNKLDVTVNPNLINQINAMTGLTNLYLGNGTTSSAIANNYGQSSANGIGNNPGFTGLSNCTVLALNKVKASGSLTLYNNAKLQELYINFNDSLTSVNNFTVHSGLITFYAYGCSSLTLPDIHYSDFPVLTAFALGSVTLSNIDLSGRSSTTNMTINILNCTSLSSLTLPSNTINCKFGTTFQVFGCSGLTAVNNLDKVSYSNTVDNNNIFTFYSNALNMTFPLGINNFIPNSIQLQHNGMSQSNINATIMNIHNNRNKWDSYTRPKSLNIAGTNAAASGTYQAPSVAGSPATAKEAIWELVNIKGWAITYN